MKNLEKDAINTLIEIIGSTPSYQIAHFTQSGTLLTDMISQYCLKREFLYQINCTDKKFYEEETKIFENVETTKVIHFPLARRSYMIQAREYNFIFITISVEESERKNFLSKVHKIIRSAGSIILFIEKNNYEQRDHWIATLEETLYVSTSVIDDLFKEYDIIISRKMHGWGQ